MSIEINASDARRRAHEHMEAALAELDSVGEEVAAILLDHAISTLGVRSPRQTSDLIRKLTAALAG